MHSKRVNLTVGIVYSRGRDKRTFVNGSDRLPFLDTDASLEVRYRYTQVGATFRINYFFLCPPEEVK